MIITALLYILYSIIYVLFLLLPASQGLPSDFSAGLAFMVGQAEQWNGFVPVYHIITIFGLIFAFEAGVLLYKTVNWILNKIRGSGGG